MMHKGSFAIVQILSTKALSHWKFFRDTYSSALEQKRMIYDLDDTGIESIIVSTSKIYFQSTWLISARIEEFHIFRKCDSFFISINS